MVKMTTKELNDLAEIDKNTILTDDDCRMVIVYVETEEYMQDDPESPQTIEDARFKIISGPFNTYEMVCASYEFLKTKYKPHSYKNTEFMAIIDTDKDCKLILGY